MKRLLDPSSLRAMARGCAVLGGAGDRPGHQAVPDHPARRHPAGRVAAGRLPVPPPVPLAVDLCRVTVPPPHEVGPGRQAACHRAEEVLGGLRPPGAPAQLAGGD